MNGKKYDVVCLSDCCCDIIFEGLERIPPLGGEEYGKALRITSGGGANTPMGLARLGIKTGYVSAIGNDTFGEMIGSRLKEFGVSGEFLQTGQSFSTWVSAVLSTKNDRAFVSHAGTPAAFDAKLAEKVLPQTRHLHSYLHYGLKFAELAGLCKEYGVSISFDSAADPGLKLKTIEKLLGAAAIFTPNCDEALALTGASTPEEALRILGGLCEYVVVTLGKDGCIASKNGKLWRASAAEVPQKVDSNGAGDLFTAGLLSAYLKGGPIETQLKTASASGSLAVTYAGGITRDYTLDAVNALISKVSIQLI